MFFFEKIYIEEGKAMFEKNNLTKQKLEELAELILWLVPAHANVAVGSAAWPWKTAMA